MVLIRSIAKTPIGMGGKVILPGEKAEVADGEYLKKFIFGKYVVIEEKNCVKESLTEAANESGMKLPKIKNKKPTKED